MTPTAFCIFFDQDRRPAVVCFRDAKLEIAPVDALADASHEEIAALLADQLKQRGYQGQGVVVGLPSGDVLVRTFEVEERGVRDRAGLKFALEEYLPFDAEQSVADFDSSHGCVFGVAVEEAKYARWVEALEGAGVWVQSICPVALLAMQFFRRSPESGTRLVLWGHDGHVELCEIVDGQPHQWQMVPADSQSTLPRLRVALLSLPANATIETHDLSPELMAAVQVEGVGGALPPCDQTPLLEAAARGAADVLAGSHTLWIDLCRDELSGSDRYRALRPYWRLLSLAVILFVGAILVAMWVRSFQYQAQIRRTSDQLGQLYRELYPGRTVPVGVRSRLESELTNLIEQQGESIDTAETRSALPTIFDLLAAVSPDGRLQFTKIEVRAGEIVIDGEVTNLGQSQLIAVGLNQRGFEVSVPYEERTEHGTVSFRLTARKADASVPVPGVEL